MSCFREHWKFAVLLLIAFLAIVPSVDAAKISELVEANPKEQLIRFFSFKDDSLRYAVLGSMLLGASCGLLGSFIVVRKMALVGDTLSHAVLPGVALGFLWNMSKDPVPIFVGATAVGLLGTTMVTWITHTTKLKEDSALGLVLATFFAAGICLVTIIQSLPTGSKSGIDKFLFGQAAALGPRDIVLMAIVLGLTVVLLTVFYHGFLVTSFDLAFARAIGFPARLLHETLMLLLAFSVVVALQAVGVVLVSAMLITPAASAYLLSDRMHRMLVLSAFFGLFAGVAGAFFSFMGTNLPTGPFMVLGASSVFGLAFFLGPRHGVIPRWWRHRSRAIRTRRENTLKSIYHVLEEQNFDRDVISIESLAQYRRETLEDAQAQARNLQRVGLATLATGGTLALTPAGWRRACAIVRNHRLWELYLTNAANYDADHVHEDAEKIEHVLGEETVRHLERRLEFPNEDPHGKPIPSIRDMQRYDTIHGGRTSGYG